MMRIDQNVVCYVDDYGNVCSYDTSEVLCPATAEQTEASVGQGDTAAGAIGVSLRQILLQAAEAGQWDWRVYVTDGELRCWATGCFLREATEQESEWAEWGAEAIRDWDCGPLRLRGERWTVSLAAILGGEA